LALLKIDEDINLPQYFDLLPDVDLSKDLRLEVVAFEDIYDK